MDIPMNITPQILNIPMDITPQILMDNPIHARSLRFLQELYLFTHILPSHHDFLTQINNGDPLYRALYWLNREHLYNRFLDEEIDLYAMSLMTQDDWNFLYGSSR